MSGNVCLAVVAYKERLTPSERESALQYRRVFPDRPVVLVAREGLTDLSDYEGTLGDFTVRTVAAEHFSSKSSYNRLCLTPGFYRLFRDYGHVLTAQLDGWANYDTLDWWASRGADYIGGPWFNLWVGSQWVRGLERRRGGNGGVSLRRVEAMIRYTEAMEKAGIDFSRSGMGEDVVFSGGLPSWWKGKLPELAYWPYEDQARFCWNNPGDGEYSRGVEEWMFLHSLTMGTMPSFFHQPTERFAKTFRLPDVPPEHVFVFSSAVRRDHDYRTLVNGICPDPGRRLLVFLNKCPAFTANESGRGLLLEQGRVLTMHNDTVEPPYGFSYRGEIPMNLRQCGFTGRHDSLCLRWRPDPGETSVTYDGEIPAARETAVLRTVTAGQAHGLAPTAGYMAYRILRDRWPAARIHLVNFHGNANGFSVNWRHRPEWEQAEYLQDPLTDRVFAG